MLEHGGALNAAAIRYGIAAEDWLDLSTGINPWGWPAANVPPRVWQRLPETDDGLEREAARYYATDQLLAVPGSQAAIQALPMLRPATRIGVLQPSYAEHAHAWHRHGHRVTELSATALEAAVNDHDVMVITCPNNPTGACFAPQTLLAWRENLASRGGWLVVDEAFADATPQHSIASHAGLPGLIVLRSAGKFFGLAGARVGFVLAEAALRARLAESVGPWAINGPGRWVVSQALADRGWQQDTRAKLIRASGRLAKLLGRHRLAVAGGTALFQWLTEPQAAFFQDALARRGILVRRFEDPPSLRFGLPGDEEAMRRLDLALTGVRAERLSGPWRDEP